MFPSHSQLLFFIGAALVLLAIPGPAVLYIVGRSIGRGRNAGFVSALGIGVGTLVHTGAAAMGLSALLVSSATAFSVVKYLGAAYLIFLGGQRLRSEESWAAASDAAAPRASLARVFGQGIVVNVLNPKTALFFFAFLLRFYSPVRRSKPRPRRSANSLSRSPLRRHGHGERQRLGRARDERRRLAARQPALDAQRTLRLRRPAHLARLGHGVRRVFRQEVALPLRRKRLALA
jgi:threonine/homoserine/homoserine lactone efflux protein